MLARSLRLPLALGSAAWKRPTAAVFGGAAKPPVRVPARPASYVRFGAPGPQHGRGGGRRPGVREVWQNPRFRKIVYTAGGLGVVVYVTNLETVPVSGRRRFNVISANTEVMLAQQMYQQTLAQFSGQLVSEYHPASRRVRRVMKRLVPVSGLDGLDWEVHVIKDDSIKNAFVIPGGKVFVFSGILPLCKDDDGLAAVLSHEISHTVAHHTSERLSKSLIAVAALVLIAAFVGDFGPLGRMLMDLVYLRPGSRRQEAEADYIGIMMMAQACYDPEKAVGLWERMEQEQQHAPPQFLSTHPSNKARIENIVNWLPEARDKQNLSDCASTLDYAQQFQRVFNYANW